MKDNLSLKNPAAKKPTEMSMSKLWTNVLYFTGSCKEKLVCPRTLNFVLGLSRLEGKY